VNLAAKSDSLTVTADELWDLYIKVSIVLLLLWFSVVAVIVVVLLL